MRPEQVKTAADARRIVEERGLSHVKVGVFDIDGILRGKYMSKPKFFSALEGGFGFCDVVLGWDSNDQLYDNVRYTGWHTAYPDAPVRVLPATCRELPFEGDMLLFLGEFSPPAEAVCPRGTLRRVLARAASHGFSVYAACEYEFFVFEETPDSVREKGYRNLKPITPGYFGYSGLRSSVHAEQLGHQRLLAGDEMAHQLAHPVRRLGVVEDRLAALALERHVDVAALPRPVVRPLGHEGRHQPAALRQHLEEGLEQGGAIGRLERLVDGDRRLEHAGAGLGMQPLDRHPHRLAGGEDLLVELGMDRAAQAGIAEIARRDRLQVATAFLAHRIGVSSKTKNSYSQAA